MTLRALGWDHPRCMSPMRACAEAWARAGHPTIAWEARSLTDFGDGSLDEPARTHDLLVIDHPMCGLAARDGLVRPLDELLDAGALARLQRGAIGPSQESYEFAGHTWGLAADAACQVSALGPRARIDAPPTDWAAAVDIARGLGRRATLPLAPAHAITSLISLWAGTGLEPVRHGRLVDPDRGLEAVDWLVELQRTGHPEATRWEPPEALAALCAGEIDYIPLTYSYVNYQLTPDAERRCRFIDIPGTRGAVLGGAGLAVSAFSRQPQQAAAFAVWACSDEVQLEIVARMGGQPGSAACWQDPELDAEAHGFYSSTRSTMEAAWVRPRDPWWPEFQDRAGQSLTRGMEQREPPRRLLSDILDIYDRVTTQGGAFLA